MEDLEHGLAVCSLNLWLETTHGVFPYRVRPLSCEVCAFFCRRLPPNYGESVMLPPQPHMWPCEKQSLKAQALMTSLTAFIT